MLRAGALQPVQAATWDGTVASAFAGGTGTDAYPYPDSKRAAVYCTDGHYANWNGTGTAAKPYLVNSPAQLKALSGYVNGGGNTVGVYWRQTADIVLNSNVLTSSGALNGTPAADMLVGSYSQMTVPVGAYGYSGNGGAFVKVGSGVVLPPLRAYLWLGSQSAAKSLHAVFTGADGIVTSVGTTAGGMLMPDLCPRNVCVCLMFGFRSARDDLRCLPAVRSPCGVANVQPAAACFRPALEEQLVEVGVAADEVVHSAPSLLVADVYVGRFARKVLRCARPAYRPVKCLRAVAAGDTDSAEAPAQRFEHVAA
jgi:hypothetical protein